MSKYRSPWSVANRKQIVIDKNDPRNKDVQGLNNYKSKAGSKVIINSSVASPILLEDYAEPFDIG